MRYYKITQASWVVVVGILMTAVLGFCVWTYPVSSTDTSITDYNQTEIVAVEEVLASPENFTGTIGVTGKVMSIDQSKSMFFMGCKGPISCACSEMPVKFGGEMPEIGSDVVVFGEIATTEAGKYVFKGQEVKSQ
jgi:hypothetical protein